jgi:heme-degrading monooxygenase HmoA
MLIERAEMLVKDGMEEQFARAIAMRGVPLLKAVEGVKSVSFGRCVEAPNKFMLLVEWSDMDAHIAFWKLPSFVEFRGIVSPFTTGGGMEHFEMA